ncbi:AIR synthase related protein, N-terminal domain [Nitrosomonas sp. Nm58]|nr:AIR synthase related protein [Nitrosomonas sp. Nm58]SDY06309.1 AIR synthase related protein, N-terminal domain [Nitrosomonas sp. Nm58]
MNGRVRSFVPTGRMVMLTGSHMISPLFFPGDDIGRLSVHGTLNDVAMSGARPRYLSATFILEEGFPLMISSALPKILMLCREKGKEASKVLRCFNFTRKKPRLIRGFWVNLCLNLLGHNI